MKTSFIIFLILAFPFGLQAQEYTSSSIFAHNDYAQPVPLFNAYNLGVGYIEADVFLEKNELMVAHVRDEIKKKRSLEELYLKPLQTLILQNSGSVYAATSKTLFLMIDLKTETANTLNLLVKKLRKYPTLISCRSLIITVSGNMPEPKEWGKYPDFIHFDGRPGIEYTEEQLSRVSLISASFSSYSKWNGKGVLTKIDREKITSVIEKVHGKGKKIRFWGSPDFNNAWVQFMHLGIDVLNTDHVNTLASFLQQLPFVTYQNNNPYPVYDPLPEQYKEQSTPKNIILMIGDGMGLTQMYSGYTANHGRLNIFNIDNIGFSITYSSDSYITDSAAGASAMASGKKTNNRHVGVDSAGNATIPITQELKLKGFKTAVISNGDVTDATPAAFYAHHIERSASEAIAQDFVSNPVHILIGAGSKPFKSRTDGRNLLDELKNEGYIVSESVSSIDSIQSTKFLILDDTAGIPIMKGRKNFLSKALSKSAELLSRNGNPFFIVTEGAQIDWGGHANNLEYLVSEFLDFDQAVGEAMRFVDQNKETLLIITADHETGGLSLIGGDQSKGYVHGSFSTTDHTAVMVPVFAYGPGSELFRGVYQNTDIYSRILEALKLR